MWEEIVTQNNHILVAKFLENMNSVVPVFERYFIHIFVAGTHVFSLDTPLTVKSNQLPPCLHIVSGSKQRERTVLVSNAVELENVCLI